VAPGGSRRPLFRRFPREEAPLRGANAGRAGTGDAAPCGHVSPAGGWAQSGPQSSHRPMCDARGEREEGEPACKPGSVEGNHSSGTRVTAGLERPTRKRARIDAAPFTGLLPYLALLQVGFTVPSRVATDAVRSYRTVSPLPAHTREDGSLGGLLSVALSVGSRPPGVTWHLIRRSPDFPPHFLRNAAIARPAPRTEYSRRRRARRQKPRLLLDPSWASPRSGPASAGRLLCKSLPAI